MDRIELMNELCPGDVFCSRNPMWLGRAICWFEKLRAEDNRAEYSHSGVIIGRPDITFEALWTNRKQSLFRAYAGTKVLVGRYDKMTPEFAVKGWDGIKHHEGEIYAGWRLIFHALPFCSKIGSGRFAVCSEIVGKFIDKSGVTGERFYWKGRTPDDIADMIHNFKGWSTVFEGVLP